MSPLIPQMPPGWLATRNRAEEFARLLEGSVPASGRLAGTLDTVLLARQVAAAGHALAPVTTPRAEFRTALRTRLLAVAAVQPASAERTSSGRAADRSTAAAIPGEATSGGSRRRTQRALGVAAGAMASCVAVTGVAVAGSQSLPGDPFYGVKRTTEALQLATADGALAKGRRHLDFAATRLQELRQLTQGRGTSDSVELDPDVAQQVRSTLAAMDTETRKGTALLTDAFRSSQTPTSLQTLSKFASAQSVGLEQLLPDLPAESQTRAVASLALVAEVVDDTEELMALETCEAGCDPSTSGPGTSATPTPTTDPALVEPSPEQTATPSPGISPSTSGTPEPSLVGTPDDEASPRPDSSVTPDDSPAPSVSPSGSTQPAPSPQAEPLPVPSQTSMFLPLPL